MENALFQAAYILLATAQFWDLCIQGELPSLSINERSNQLIDQIGSNSVLSRGPNHFTITPHLVLWQVFHISKASRLLWCESSKSAKLQVWSSGSHLVSCRGQSFFLPPKEILWLGLARDFLRSNTNLSRVHWRGFLTWRWICLNLLHSIFKRNRAPWHFGEAATDHFERTQ